MSSRRKRRGKYFKQKEWPEEISRIAIRQHNNLDWALMIFGPRVCAREIIRRHRNECAQTGRKYDREYAIDQAARVRVALSGGVLPAFLPAGGAPMPA